MIQRLFCILTLLCLLTACQEAKQSLGFTRQSPDEYTAFEHTPLSLPPSYHLMPPSQAEQKFDSRQRDNAKELVMGSEGIAKDTQNFDKADQLFLKRLEAGEGKSNIRSLIDTEAPKKQKETILDKALFWKDKRPPATIVEPVGERARIEENLETSRPVNAGESQAIRPLKKGPFEDLL